MSNFIRPTFNMNLHIVKLLHDEPFFAAISRRVNKVPSRAIPTAGVRVNKHTCQFEMLYNPDFMQKLVDNLCDAYDAADSAGQSKILADLGKSEFTPHVAIQHVKGVLMHEFYHLVFRHVTSRLPTKEITKEWNYATDLAINSGIPKLLPEFCLMPGRGPFAALPLGKSAEWYLAHGRKEIEQAIEDQKQQGQKGRGTPGNGEGGSEPGEGQGGQFDTHDGWASNDEEGAGGEAGEAADESLSDAYEIAEERLRQTMAEAANEANARGWGTVSGSTRKRIVEFITPTINWKSVLRYFIKTSQRSDRPSTVRRLNRRYPWVHPGKKIRRQAKIAISIDQSNSVGDKMLAAFFAELNNLSDLAEFTVVPFDTTVAEEFVYVWKKGENRVWERVRCGGTCFDAPTKWVNERDFDGHIILTDMEAPKPVASHCQRMWMTEKRYADNPYFKTTERVIPIKIEGSTY